MKYDYHLMCFSLHPCLSLGVKDKWFDNALEYLTRTHDADGWHVMMYGA